MKEKFLYELHFHSSEVSRCATSTAIEMINAFKLKGYTGAVMTNHFINGYSSIPAEGTWESKMRYFHRPYEIAKKEGEKIGVDVFFGWEFNYDYKGDDFLTIGLDLEFLLKHPDICKYSFNEYSEAVHSENGIIIHAHPFREAAYLSKAPEPRNAPDIDGIEVINGSGHNNYNDKALEWAKLNNLRRYAASDAHNVGGITSGVYLPRRAKDNSDLVSLLLGGNVRLYSENNNVEDYED